MERSKNANCSNTWKLRLRRRLLFVSGFPNRSQILCIAIMLQQAPKMGNGMAGSWYMNIFIIWTFSAATTIQWFSCLSGTRFRRQKNKIETFQLPMENSLCAPVWHSLSPVILHAVKKIITKSDMNFPCWAIEKIIYEQVSYITGKRGRQTAESILREKTWSVTAKKRY